MTVGHKATVLHAHSLFVMCVFIAIVCRKAGEGDVMANQRARPL